MTRLHKIKRAVGDLSVSQPADPIEGFWMSFRDIQNYFRYINDEPRYDVYLKTDARFDRAGFLQVSALVALYDVQLEYTVTEEMIFSRGFGGNDQPREQMFLNNLGSQYPRKAQSLVDEMACDAVYWELGETEIEYEA